MRRPGLTVCIPVFGDSILAQLAVGSALDVADEILVYRDGPQEDRYWPRFEARTARLAKVRILRGERHLGYLCKNVFLREATHTLLHFLDADELVNENYRASYEEALRFTERTRGVTCLRVQDLHGDTGHAHRYRCQLYDTSHSLAYRSEALHWDNAVTADNPEGYENVFGARVSLFPSGEVVDKPTALDYDHDDELLLEPLIVHLNGVKENRLIAYRGCAYDFQRNKPGCSIDDYVRRRGAERGLADEEIYEKLACEWLNSWGEAVPLAARHGKMPEILERLRDVVVCEWRDGYVVRRDDAGWRARSALASGVA